MSLFARGDFGDENITNVTGGLRIYLSDDPGTSRSIERHREDDPKVYAPTFPVLPPDRRRRVRRSRRRSAPSTASTR